MTAPLVQSNGLGVDSVAVLVGWRDYLAVHAPEVLP